MRSFADVKIIFEGKSVTLRAMTDSGNLLREPISYKPCIVADKGRVVDIFPREIAEVIHKKSIADIGEYLRNMPGGYALFQLGRLRGKEYLWVSASTK